MRMLGSTNKEGKQEKFAWLNANRKGWRAYLGKA